MGAMTKKKKTNRKKMTNLIIIDASTSMSDKVDEVKGGLKLLFKQIKEDAAKDEMDISTIVLDFSSPGDFNVLINSKDADDLKDSVADDYKVRGMTALYDAIGRGFNMIKGKPDGVFVNILTDGQENSSQEFKHSDVEKLIKEGREKNWAITFMGTTEGALTQAKSLGISGQNVRKFDNSAKGVQRSMKMSMESRTMYYSNVMSDNHVTTDMLGELAEKEIDKKEKKKDDIAKN